MMRDRVDQVMEEWARQRPELKLSGMAVIGRINRLAERFGAAHAKVLRRLDLDRGEFEVLAALRRSGAPYRLSPGALARALTLSAGGVTNRLNRLEAAGFVRREAHPGDRRALQVELTGEGRLRADVAMDTLARHQRQLLASYPPLRQQQLVRALRELLLAVEGGPEDEDA